MKSRTLPFSLLALLPLASTPLTAEEPTIQTVSLFKNGIALVEASGQTDVSGVATLETLPTPVVGTFWVDAQTPTTSKIELREVPVPASYLNQQEMLRALEGKTVNLIVGEKEVSIRGRLLKMPEAKDDQWGRNYTNVTQPTYSWWQQPRPGPQALVPGPLVFVEKENGLGIESVASTEIRRILFDQMPEGKRKAQALVFNSGEASDFTLRYLSRGIAWVPSYRLDVSDPKTMRIDQKAVIRNELAELSDVEIRLISGYPSIRFAHVDSPFSAETNWSTFFQQLAQNPQSGSGAWDNGLILSNSISQSVAPQAQGGGVALGAADAADSVDLHYESVGRHHLKPGESLNLTVASEEADYKRIVDWSIMDDRDEWGRPQQRTQNTDDAPWDAISFHNPFEFPMTTASAMLQQDGKFQGQQMVHWTNPGQRAKVRITKALSVTTLSMERELPNTREPIRILGRKFQEVDVEGTLKLKNHRGQEAVVEIERRFSGELLKAEGDPKEELLEQGAWTVNQRNQLHWEVTIPAGESRTIKYSYRLLVYR